MYQAIMGKLNETQGQTGIQTPDARIISPAAPPVRPSFPRKDLTMAVAVPAGLVLGLLFAFMAEWLDAGFRTRTQLETVLGLPVLATVPEVKTTGDSIAQARAVAERIIDKPMSAFAEAIRGLQLGLTLSNVDKKPKVVVITSSMPGEGKTVLAVSLARLAAISGVKTLIIDGDFRRPMVLGVMGAKAECGIVEALSGSQRLDQCIVKDVRSDAQILPCLRTPPNSLDLLSSAAMHLLMDSVRKSFDLVIVDSAPMLPVNDTKILSKLADTVLFTVLWEKTPRDAAVNAIRCLADVHATIGGVAFSRADPRRFQYYSYGNQDYYSYSKYYRD
jgi:capsular exopolysaccharide synthesis family protein